MSKLPIVKEPLIHRKLKPGHQGIVTLFQVTRHDMHH